VRATSPAVLNAPRTSKQRRTFGNCPGSSTARRSCHRHSSSVVFLGGHRNGHRRNSGLGPVASAVPACALGSRRCPDLAVGGADPTAAAWVDRPDNPSRLGGAHPDSSERECAARYAAVPARCRRHLSGQRHQEHVQRRRALGAVRVRTRHVRGRLGPLCRLAVTADHDLLELRRTDRAQHHVQHRRLAGPQRQLRPGLGQCRRRHHQLVHLPRQRPAGLLVAAASPDSAHRPVRRCLCDKRGDFSCCDDRHDECAHRDGTSYRPNCHNHPRRRQTCSHQPLASSTPMRLQPTPCWPGQLTSQAFPFPSSRR
jgi:hypothetical protein